jgi:hypothetical protein
MDLLVSIEALQVCFLDLLSPLAFNSWFINSLKKNYLIPLSRRINHNYLIKQSYRLDK